MKEKTKMRCHYCGRTEICKGSYPEGCFLDNKITESRPKEINNALSLFREIQRSGVFKKQCIRKNIGGEKCGDCNFCKIDNAITGLEEYASLKQSEWISVEDELKGKKPPSLIQAHDTRVMVNGRPIPVPFRIVSEENYQILIKGKIPQPPNNKQG